MSVSVIIPVCNQAHLLPRTLVSVLQQSLNVPFEVIVVDDGSTDDSAAVAQSFAPKVSYIFQEKQGLSAARNTGLHKASGDALVFMNPGDLFLPQALQSQWDHLQSQTNVHISICCHYTFIVNAEDGRVQVEDYIPLPRVNLGVHLCATSLAPPHSYMLRRLLADQAGNFDTGLHICEDYDYWLRCLGQGGIIISNPHASVLQRRHGKDSPAELKQQTAFEGICNKRVGQMLQNKPLLWGPRLLDAYMAHLFGSVSRVHMALAHYPDMFPPLLRQCLDAAARIKRLCGTCGAAPVAATLGTTEPRSEDEVLILQYYALRALFYLRNKPGALREIYTLLEQLFPQCQLEGQAWDDMHVHWHSQMHWPQDLPTVAAAARKLQG